MGNDDINIHKDHGFKKKTSFQLQSLENFYSENKYPKQKVMENYAASLDLTYKEIRTWFVERRRKQKRENKDRSSSKKNIVGNDRARAPGSSAVKCSGNNRTGDIALLADHKQVGRENKRRMRSKNKLPVRFQVLFSKDYILKKVFRKDGPPLGTEFDPLQANAFCRDAKSLQLCQDSQRIPKRRKVMESRYLKPVSPHVRNAPAKKYGIGKGLMTVWRATNLDSGKSPTGINCMDKSVAWMPVRSSAPPKETLCQVSKRLQRVEPVLKHRSTQKKLEKRGPLSKKRKVPCSKDNNLNKPSTECKLGVDKLNSLEQSNALMTLVDDEELELRELQATSNPLRCSAHLTSSGRHGCPLCKDLLARFPPQIVKMKQPFSTRPWDSSPELVKKLFKVFQFLYSHGAAVEVSPFTLDDFAQTFHDKDSLLLGEIHVALLKMLLLDVERVIIDGFNPRASKDCRFLGFLHFVKEQELNVNLWSQSLNPLTWTEILRQILIAAGFGSKNNTMRRELFSKERNRMVKYGLRPRTLKGELFSVLYEKGSSGLKVSELAKASQIIALDLPNTTAELEQLICFTLSSDITLFEKIAPAAYRLRVDPHIKGKYSQSDSDDSGSVDDDSLDSSESGSSDESVDSDELNSPISEQRVLRYKARLKKKGQLTQYTEIDESYTGEAWVLGLMEGEYSNLNIEEKLDALVALVDLAGTGCSLRMEEPVRTITAIFPDTQYHGFGAKIKKSATNNHLVIKAREGPVPCVEETLLSPDSFPFIPSEIFSMASKKEHSSDGIKNTDATEESGPIVHPLRSIYLGSDRRYNSYWLFLGPCNPNDPGHRRVYFESSEDGHWEVIDTAQAFRALRSVLDCRGSRESRLFASLETKEEVLCQAMDDYMTAETESRQRKGSDPSDIDHSSGDSSSPISDIDNIQISAELTNSLLSASGVIVLELGKNVEEKKQRWNRLQAFDKWIWNSFYSNLNAVKNNKRSFMESLARCESCHDLYWRDEKHCKICHSTFEVDFDLEERYTIHGATCRETEDSSEFPKHKVLPSQLQALKAAIHAIELSLPDKALAEAWKRSGHKLWVKRLRRTSSLPELLQVLTDFVGAINEEWLNERAFALGCMALDEIVVYFQTMPQTTSAVALWMVRLDMLIAPHLERLLSERTLGSLPQSKRSGSRLVSQLKKLLDKL